MFEFLRVAVRGRVQLGGSAIGRLPHPGDEVRVFLSNEDQFVLTRGREVPQDMQELPGEVLMNE